MDIRDKRVVLYSFIIILVTFAGWTQAATSLPNDKCLYRTKLTLGNTEPFSLSDLTNKANTSDSPCEQTGSGSGVWYSVTGDGTLYNLTVCSNALLTTHFFVGIHVDNDCELQCVASSDSNPELAAAVDFCLTGVTWQTVPAKEYQILFYTKSSATQTVYFEVNGYGCDANENGVNTGAVVDECGVCNGDGTSCGYRGCDGVVGSGKKVDVCGVCGGFDNTCLSGCDHQPNSDKLLDPCGVCGGNGSTCTGCDGVPVGDASLRVVEDACGVCGGNNATCLDCSGVPNGPNVPDMCGVCGGNSSTCVDCAGCPFGTAVPDDCGVCAGDNSTCYGCDGVKHSNVTLDICGVCGGDGLSCSLGCDASVPFSEVDACGVCNGDNSTCMCVEYEDFTVPEMDCRLVRFSLSNIVQQIDSLLATLLDIRNKTQVDYSAEAGARRYVEEEVIDSNDFLLSCVNYYASTLNSFIDDDVAPAAGIV